MNPPILHRKELLIDEDHKFFNLFTKLSDDAEAAGLFEAKHQIGFKRFWLARLQEKGLEVRENTFYQIKQLSLTEEHNEDYQVKNFSDSINRYRTALVRYDFSTPIQILAKHGYLDGSKTIFDYGCGRGDDIRGLIENNICACGWDPHYAASNPLVESNIVNLGFVINVIENQKRKS